MPAGQALLSKDDVVLAVGTNVFAGYFYFSGPALSSATKLVHIDSAYGEIGKTEPTDVGIAADPKSALADLAEALDSDMSGTARESARVRIAGLAQQKAAQIAARDQRLKDRWDLSPMSAERMMHELAAVLPPDTIIADDSVTSRDAIHDAITFNEPGSVFGERGGALGWGMGGAMGVKLANPNRPVVGVIGDGSSMMTVQALWTAANSRIPVVYVICNNRAYRILKLNMNAYKTQILGEQDPQSEYLAMDFPTPMNIAGIADAIGVHSRKIEDPADLAPAMRQALELGAPAVLDVSIDGTV
jgi:benzoylformate decarboxylase